MSSFNKAILVGRLGKDPESRNVSGKTVVNFTVANDESYKDRNGEQKKKTEWHKIVVWGKQAEIAQQYLKKGSLVLIEGKIQTRSWDKDGVKQYSTEIMALSVQLLDSRHAVSDDEGFGS